jgi:hypothetical protein
MLFPWVGLLEQIRLADVYVHYDDVAFSKGGFTNRVQLKTPRGSQWMTIPLEDHHLGDRIDATRASRKVDWRDRHVAALSDAYAAAPFVREMLALVEGVYAKSTDRMDQIAGASVEALAEYFGLAQARETLKSSALNVEGRSSERVLAIVQAFGGDRYVTGHGARKYLDHEAFDRAGISVEYLDYQKLPYPQLHGPFDPFVSALDLVANCGRDGARFIRSPAVPWKELVAR